MPNLDKTGPQGKGPKTGRGAGDCDGNIKDPKVTGRGFGGRIFKNFGNRGRRGR